jgi:GTP-binding protein
LYINRSSPCQFVKSIVPHYPDTYWVRAAANLRSLPPERTGEVAFVGRSNSGKSSSINAIVGRKRLAFVSKTPGRTQSLNFFGWGDDHYLVDLPGYGYAAVSAERIEQWGKAVSAYLETRRSLRGLVVVMDVRHPFKEIDLQLIEWAASLGLPLHLLLTKSDKLTRSEASRALAQAQVTLAGLWPKASVQLFSAKSGLGLAAARALVARWLNSKKTPG